MRNRLLFCFSLVVVLVAGCNNVQTGEQAAQTRLAAQAPPTQPAGVRTAVAKLPVICPTPPAPADNSQAGSQAYPIIITGESLVNVDLELQKGTGLPYLVLDFNSEGGQIFGDFTAKHVGGYLGIAVNKKLLSAPVITSPIYGGHAILQGGFAQAQAEEMQRLLLGCPKTLELVDLGDTALSIGEIIQTKPR